MVGRIQLSFLRILTAASALRQDRRGATAIEYALIGTGISIALVGVLFALGDEITGLFGDIESDFSSRRPG